MSRKKLDTDKSWWVKIPSGIYEALKHAAPDKSKIMSVLGIITLFDIIYSNRKYSDGYIRLSVIKTYMGLNSKSKVKQLTDILQNKWLFHSMKLEIDKDILIQPVIDVHKMNENRVNDILQAIRFQDYDKLLELSPNCLQEYYNINSRSLFQETGDL